MKHRYAHTYSGDQIDALSVVPSDRRRFGTLTCPGCGREVIPVLGDQRQRHFRHKHDGATACSGESYIHAIAKRIFVNAFLRALAGRKPFPLTVRVMRYCDRWKGDLGFVCRLKDGARVMDLTSYFDRVEEEATVGGFIADVLLTSSKSDEKLLVEIKVTHACEPEKLASGLRIAEVEIATEDEARGLASGIDEFSGKTKLYNFRPQEPERVSCSSDCGSRVAFFHVFESGKAVLQTDHPKQVREVMRRRSTIYSRRIQNAFVTGFEFQEEALRAYQSGVEIKVCSICRYAGFDTLEKPVFCKIRRKEVGNSDAATCSMYRPES